MPRLQRKSQINTEDKMNLGAELTDLNGAYLNSIFSISIQYQFSIQYFPYYYEVAISMLL